MFKRVFSVILVLVCCFLSIVAFPEAEHPHTKENNVHGDNGSAVFNVTSLSSGTAFDDPEMIIASDCVHTVTVDSDYLEWLLSVPNEVLSASTPALLDYFLQSKFMGQQVFSCASTPDSREIDFSCHEAFRELISRDDFTETLESYAGSILNGSKSDQLRIGFEKLLAQPLVRSLIADFEKDSADCPNLKGVYSTIYKNIG